MSDPRLYEWLALRKVAGGGVVKSAGLYLDHGRPVPLHVTELLDQLRWSGLLVVADGDPLWSLRRVSLTDAGQSRYLELCRERAAVQPPPPEFGTARTATRDQIGTRPNDPLPQSPATDRTARHEGPDPGPRHDYC